jgi:hypothetical protein
MDAGSLKGAEDDIVLVMSLRGPLPLEDDAFDDVEAVLLLLLQLLLLLVFMLE